MTGQRCATSPEHADRYAEERTFLGAIAEALAALGALHAEIRQPYGMGTPFLHVVGDRSTGHGEDVRLRRVADDGSLRAVWQWGEDLPLDPRQAAAAIRRVVAPEM
ncbi:hypothetical protein [Actinomadura atramentaria]|uniref:hypothetical protein n=1 Tax=Actinomadura atramentaria TaxID=1990 RepID=UPI00037816C3|nr:hypothetical protein [Actinomadura atramentaria]